ncbi:MAG: hypothetical protein ACK4WH_04355 [Phycisphaerales bacterium]
MNRPRLLVSIAERCRTAPMLTPVIAALLFAFTQAGCSGAAAERGASGVHTTSNTVEVDLHVLAQWPDELHQRIRVAQTQTGHSPAAPAVPSPNTLDDAETDRVLAYARERNALLASPRLLLHQGRPATLRLGEDLADGTPLNGLRFDVTAARRPGPAGASVALAFHEYGTGPDAHPISASTTLRFNPDQTAFVLATGIIGSPPRLILVRTHDQAPAPKSGNACLDSLDYPRVTVMAVHSEFACRPDLAQVIRAAAHGSLPPRPLSVRPAGARPESGVVITFQRPHTAEPTDDWAALVPTDRVRSVFDVFRTQPGYRHVASPFAVLTPSAWATIEPESIDKARHAVGTRMELTADPFGGAATLSMRWSRADRRALAAADALAIPGGYALAVILAPRLPGDPWRSVVFTPEIVLRPDDYPVQTSTSLAP